ncbi:hypothetical protein PNOK_0106200 [Pyrrhoderma noxium]|uniref:Cyclase n=1 Tax=Pyrrhoderma noxium TaxID=2282107 RepID=A0A286UWT7_9AGAM|nr:hypothetical protein PNOK_0106200 [Pyrrhoderma noxium]
MVNGKNWDTESLPKFDDLPSFHEYTGCAWGAAAKENIQTGRSVCLNWPVNFPEKPLFSRKAPHIELIKRTPTATSQDDEININSQSGSQWDGLRHFGVTPHGVFYQNTPSTFFKMGKVENSDPLKVDQEAIKYGIHNWAQHGISGRAVFLDLYRYYTSPKSDQGAPSPLPYDPWTSHSITVPELEACARAQGVTFKKADILLIRIGFIKKYMESSQEEKDALAGKEETFTGVEQSEEMKRFLWDNHFAAVASDQPTFERWPPVEGKPHMHQTIIGLWGMPIGEMFDLEKLSEVCAETGRYTFFFTSWPLNVLGGCASPPNAAAYF